MFFINRSVAVIKPKQPFADWVNSLADAGDDQYTIQDFSTDCSVILLPVVDSDEQAEAFIKDMFRDLFELELSSWMTDDETWPEKRTYKMFLDWFDVEFHSMVFDHFPEIAHIDDSAEVHGDPCSTRKIDAVILLAPGDDEKAPGDDDGRNRKPNKPLSE